MEEMAGISDSTHPNTRHADTPRPNRIDETTQQLVEQHITALLEAIPRDQSPEVQAALKSVQLSLGTNKGRHLNVNGHSSSDSDSDDSLLVMGPES